MKTCPVCKTDVFDDMDTCFGCMHRFGAGEARQEAESSEGAQAERGVVVDDAPKGSWILRVQMNDPTESRSWAFELSR